MASSGDLPPRDSKLLSNQLRNDLSRHLLSRLPTMDPKSRRRSFTKCVERMIEKCGSESRESYKDVTKRLVDTLEGYVGRFCRVCIQGDCKEVAIEFEAIEEAVKIAMEALGDESCFAVAMRPVVIEMLSKACVAGICKDDVEFDDPLHLAVKYDCQEAAELLLTFGWDINSVCAGDQTALHHAVLDKRYTMIAWLLSRGADCECRAVTIARMAQSRMTPMHCAAYQLDLMAAQIICRNCPVGNAMLLRQNQDKRTSLHFAVLNYRGGSLDLIEFFCKQSAQSLCSPDRDGQLPLHYAARRGTVSVVNLLLQTAAKANDELFRICLNSQDDEGRTAIHLAVEGRHIAAVDVLCKRGSDLEIRTYKRKETPLEMARALNPYSDLVQILQRYERAYGAEKRLFKEETSNLKLTKLMVCGASGVGKSTFCRSLNRNSNIIFSDFIDGFARDDPGNPKERTVGIDIKVCDIPGVGRICVLDFGGEMTYYVTHSLFLGARNSIIIIMTNLQHPEYKQQQYLQYWAGFIRASYKLACDRRPAIFLKDTNRRPKVIVIASHRDKPNKEGESPLEFSRKKLVIDNAVKTLRDVFSQDLDIHENVFYIDCRKRRSMDSLRPILEYERFQLEQNLKPVSKLSEAVLKKIEYWHFDKDQLPMVSFGKFQEAIQSENPRADQTRIEDIVLYLDLIGEIILIGDGSDRLVFLHPSKLCSDLLGELLCPRTIAALQPTIHADGKVSKSIILQLFSKWKNRDHIIPIFTQLQLCYQPFTEEDSLLVIPALLSDLMFPTEKWPSGCNKMDSVFAGRRFQCSQQQSILEYKVFSRLMVSLQQSLNLRDPPVWANGILFEVNSAHMIVHYRKEIRAVDVVVQAPRKTKHDAAELLETVDDHVESFISLKHEVKKLVCSARSLQEKNGLECEIVYSYEEVQQELLHCSPETPFRERGYVEHAVDMLHCECYDRVPMPSNYHGCSIGMLPQCINRFIQNELDPLPIGTRASWKDLAERCLGLRMADINALEERMRDCRLSATAAVLDLYHKRRGTIGDLVKKLENLKHYYVQEKVENALKAYISAGGKGTTATEAAEKALRSFQPDNETGSSAVSTPSSANSDFLTSSSSSDKPSVN
eukprot:m.60903 g.60903  ORF g.60903 m.60903 type:complete len:1117 (+) comp34952_c1_seq1:80-3430(+)